MCQYTAVSPADLAYRVQMYRRRKRGLLFFSSWPLFTSLTRGIYCLTVQMAALSQLHVPAEQGSYCNNVFTHHPIIAATGCKVPTEPTSPSFNISRNGVVTRKISKINSYKVTISVFL